MQISIMVAIKVGFLCACGGGIVCNGVQPPPFKDTTPSFLPSPLNLQMMQVPLLRQFSPRYIFVFHEHNHRCLKEVIVRSLYIMIFIIMNLKFKKTQ